VTLDSITVNGQSYTLKTTSVTEAGKGRGKRTAIGAGGGAALGRLSARLRVTVKGQRSARLRAQARERQALRIRRTGYHDCARDEAQFQT